MNHNVLDIFRIILKYLNIFDKNKYSIKIFATIIMALVYLHCLLMKRLSIL